MTPLLFCLDNNRHFSSQLIKRMNLQEGELSWRDFPDGETYLNVLSDVKGRSCYINCSLYQPNTKVLPLLFLADNLKELGAKEVGLIAPYLAYMRQDIRFQPGEAVTSRYFAGLLNEHIDWMVTADPHLHRYNSLSEIYSIPTHVVHASEFISAWLSESIQKPLVIGPDEESEQWVKNVADNAGCEYLVLSKTRLGDKEVEISVPDISRFSDHTPVLVDDIISTGKTMIETTRHLLHAGLRNPMAVGVHAIFADDAYNELLVSGIDQVVTANTIPHLSNQIDLSEGFAKGIASLAK